MNDIIQDSKTKKKNIFIFSLMILLFGVPNIIALFYVYMGAKPTDKTGNKGVLVIPQIKLDEVVLQDIDGNDFAIKSLHGKWALITIENSDCNKDCMENIFIIQQIRRAQGVERSRINRVVFVKDNEKLIEFKDKTNIYERTIYLTNTSPQFSKALATLDDIAKADRGRIYIMDPRGDVMMFYEPGVDHKDILKDLKRLLKLSNIG